MGSDSPLLLQTREGKAGRKRERRGERRAEGDGYPSLSVAEVSKRLCPM